MKKAVTIKEIADSLGLSRNTVSKVLNGQKMPAKTREIVLRKASELNYKSVNFDINKAKRYRILLLSGKPLHNIEFYLPVIKSIENGCFDNHYEFFQYTYNSDNTPFEAIASHIKELKVDGILAIECFDSSFIVELAKLGIPLCFIDFPGTKFDLDEPFDLVCCSDQKLFCESAKSLIQDYKVKRFSFVGDYRHCLSFHERYMGMIRGLIRSGIPHTQSYDILDKDDEFDYGDHRAIRRRIESLEKTPEVFMCCNDFIARQVTHALKDMGINVPQDALVVGFDGTKTAMEDKPTLTTFNVDKDALGNEALRSLIYRIEHRSSPSKTTMMDCKPIIGESTSRNR